MQNTDLLALVHNQWHPVMLVHYNLIRIIYIRNIHIVQMCKQTFTMFLHKSLKSPKPRDMWRFNQELTASYLLIGQLGN